MHPCAHTYVCTLYKRVREQAVKLIKGKENAREGMRKRVIKRDTLSQANLHF